MARTKSAAPTDHNRIDDDQRQDGRLQARQRPAQRLSLPRRAIAAGGNGLDVFERLGVGRRLDVRIDVERRLGRRRDRRARSAARFHLDGESLGACGNSAPSAASDGGLSAGASKRARPPEARPRRRSAASNCSAGRFAMPGRRGHGFRHGLDRAAHRRQRLGRGDQLVGVGQFGVPDRAAAHATHLAAVRPQACHVDIVGCSAVRADDQHRRIRRRGTFWTKPSSRSVNGLETKPARRSLPLPGGC